jgi:hypothetical protein
MLEAAAGVIKEALIKGLGVAVAAALVALVLRQEYLETQIPEAAAEAVQ